jgi:hypothetical protein
MKVYMIPSISCSICSYEFNLVVSHDTRNKAAKLTHGAGFVDNAPCPQVDQTAYLDLSQFEKEL